MIDRRISNTTVLTRELRARANKITYLAPVLGLCVGEALYVLGDRKSMISIESLVNTPTIAGGLAGFAVGLMFQAATKRTEQKLTAKEFEAIVTRRHD